MTRVPEFSVVVPTLNEAASVEGTLAAARRALPGGELIVADGGSEDDTVARAAAGGARIVRAGRGRGAQMAAGARAARGAVLVFLHADTRLAPGAGEAIRRAVRAPGVAGGCFRFAVDPPARGSLRYRALEWGVNLRTRLFRTATGDQAIFARREALERVGGVPTVPLFEDVLLVRRLRRAGEFRPLAAAARTSRRRWEERGFSRTVLEHWGARLAFALGVRPERLAGWYGSPRSRTNAPPGSRDPVGPDAAARAGGSELSAPRPSGGPSGSARRTSGRGAGP